MLPALRRREVVVDLVETAAVDMEEEDTTEEAAGEGVAMVRGNKTFADSHYLSFVTEGGRGGGGGDRGYGGGRGGGGYRGRGGYDNNYNRDGGDRYNGGGRGGGRGYGNAKQH